jgi:hypothetical protein
VGAQDPGEPLDEGHHPPGVHVDSRVAQYINMTQLVLNHIKSYLCISLQPTGDHVAIVWQLVSKYEELRAGQWPTGVRKHVRAKKAAKGCKATLSSKQELFAIKNSMYRLKETEERDFSQLFHINVGRHALQKVTHICVYRYISCILAHISHISHISCISSHICAYQHCIGLYLMSYYCCSILRCKL